jgi:ethanolamine utilization microcompartment shell protein EutS
MKRSALLKFGSLPSYIVGVGAYDQDKLGLGFLTCQKTGANPDDKFVGPLPISIGRPMEASVAIPYAFPWAMRWSETETSRTDWVFAADIATAAATRRLGMYTYDRITGTLAYQGFLTVTFPGTSEAKTIRGLRMSYEKISNGTVAVSGTAVTGTTTTFSASKACVGNRIGFGSTDPSLISTWYEISAVGTDTGITLTTSAGTIAGGTPYVIEDLRAYIITTSVTTSNGGLYILKGLRKELFNGTGGAVPAATTVDRIRACYYVRDAATGTALVSFGGGFEEKTSLTSRNFWLLDTLANPVLFKYNVYADLTLTAGATTSGFLLKTGGGGVVTGTVSQNNNGRVANTAHGPGAGLNCIYFTTSSRIYRTADLSTITTAQTNWLVDNMTEVPPGGINTFAATGALNSIEYSGFIDKFIVMSSGTAGVRSYLSQYRTDGGQMDRIIFVDHKQIDQGIADSGITPIPSQLASPFTSWVEDGMLYIIRFGTTAALNHIYAIPLGCDWEFIGMTNSRIITPRIPTPNAKSFLAAFTSEDMVIGLDTGKNFGVRPEAHRIKYRTSGISDNTGTWQTIDNTGDITGVAGASDIQFSFEFRMADHLVPARILNLGVMYEDNNMSDNWQGSSNIGTDLVNKRFGFRHAVAYGTTVPRLEVELYNAETGASLGIDDSTTQAWSWEKSTNSGGAWAAYNSTDRANENTYVRVTPTSLADNIKIRAVLREF